MPNNDAIPMNVVEVLASAELNVNDNSESVAMSVAEGGAGSSRKADKVSGATAGNLAGLDATGNLTDSGKKPADFVAAENFYATQLPMSSTDPTTVAEKATDLLSAIQQKAPLIFDTVSNVAIASVSDAIAHPVTALKIGIEPVQSGSGDPYPAGGGKNKLKPLTPGSGTISSVDYTVYDDGTIKINGTATGAHFNLYFFGSGSTYADLGIPSGEYKLNGIPSGSACTITLIDSDGNSQQTGGGNDKTITVDDTKTYRLYLRLPVGNSATNEIIKPMIRLSSIADSTFAPYSNICPITGWDAVHLTGTGKNLFDKTNTNNIIKATVQTVDIQTSTNGRSVFIDCKPNTTYTVSKKAGLRFIVAYTKEIPAGNVVIYGRVSNPTGTSITITTGADAKYLVAYVYLTNTDTITEQEMMDSVQIEIGSTATAYTAYTGITHTASLPSTVFGGVIDWVNGKAYVTYVLAVFDGSNDENWNFSTSNSKNRVYTTDLASTIDNTGDVYANYLKAYQNAPYPDEWNYQKATASLVIGVPSEINSKDAWKTYLASNNLQICYKLAEPIEISLSDLDEISTVEGQNNLWSDCGDIVELTYACDTKGYIDKKIAEIQALMLEN